MELFIHRGFESVNVAGYKFSDLISDGEGDQLMVEVSMAEPLDPKEVVTVQELAVSNMLEIEALRELLFEEGVITKEEFLAKFKKLDREMKRKRGR